MKKAFSLQQTSRGNRGLHPQLLNWERGVASLKGQNKCIIEPCDNKHRRNKNNNNSPQWRTDYLFLMAVVRFPGWRLRALSVSSARSTARTWPLTWRANSTKITSGSSPASSRNQPPSSSRYHNRVPTAAFIYSLRLPAELHRSFSTMVLGLEDKCAGLTLLDVFFGVKMCSNFRVGPSNAKG